MMLLGSHFGRKPFHGTISQPVYSTPVPPHTLSVEKSDSISSVSSLPTWITQALCDLTQGEQELHHLREQQTTEVDKVNLSLDSAMCNAQKEERHLLEKVEKNHLEIQQRLLQFKRENAAAARVGQSLVDKQLQKMSLLREQILMWSRCPNGPNKTQLQKGVQELMQPWEISLSLKKVTFQPSPESSSINFGGINVREHSLSFPVGVCGAQGHKCAIHTGETAHDGHVAISEQLCVPSKGGKGKGKGSTKINSGSSRIVRKIRISTAEKDTSEENTKSPSPKLSNRWPCKRNTSESSLDEDLELLSSDSHGDDLFLAINSLSSQGELERESPGSEKNYDLRCSVSNGHRKQRALMSVSSKEPSCPPEESEYGGCIRSQEFQKRMLSPTTAFSASKSSYSCIDLSLKDTQNTQGFPGPRRSPSPAESVDSSYTFIIRSASSCTNYLRGENQHSTSKTELSARGRSGKEKKLNNSNLSSPNSNINHGLKDSYEGSKRVCRSLSMSEIERRRRGAKAEHNGNRGKREQSESDLTKVVKERRSLKVGHPIKKFGKQGSGRTDFTLPSGIHATPQGHLFIVDCGNVRVQVTDLQINVVQQVTLPASDGNSRHCRNLFDVAANSKGLIALTCAAERAVLVFNRHGRLLQTFGGSGAQPDFEAPRGVTVTRLDEFLVADIRHGTLTSLKLEPKTGSKMERTVVTGFYRPYLVATCLNTGLIAVSERGNETGRTPCIRVLEPGWNTIRILGVCAGMGPVLTSPWGICIDADGNVLVADWGKQHHVVLYPAVGMGRPIVTQGLSSPRGLSLLPDDLLVVSDSMNHCIKIYRYK